MPSKTKTVEEYINKHGQWAEALTALRELLLSAQLQETIKWSAPVYTVDGKNVVGLGAFKSYVGLWFVQGALLQDAHKKLINAQENKTRAMRQWRFNSAQEIREQAATIEAYLQETIENQKQGKTIKPDRSKALIIPGELAERLAADGALKVHFEAFSKSKQREYAEYIAEAKRDETRQKRLEKIIPMIMAGIGLHDKYRK